MNKVSFFQSGLRGGGIARVNLNLAKYFIDKGYQVDIVVVKKVGPYINQVPDKINIVDLKANRALSSIPKLVRYLNKFNPDVLISANNYINVTVAISHKLAKADTQLILSVHLDRRYRNSKSPFYRKIIMKYLMNFSYKYADEVVAVSKGVAKYISEVTDKDEDEVKVIYNPIYDKEIIEKSKEKADHPWLNESDVPVVITAARFVEQKNLSLLIRAFKIVSDKSGAKLIILGEGKLEEELKSLVKKLGLDNSISFEGFVSNPYKYIKRADVFALSSDYEGFGNVLVETLAVNTPIVSTDCPSGPSEILKNGEYGILVPVNNEIKLAEGIIKSLNSNNNKNLHERALDFSIENAGDNYIKIFRN